MFARVPLRRVQALEGVMARDRAFRRPHTAFRPFTSQTQVQTRRGDTFTKGLLGKTRGLTAFYRRDIPNEKSARIVFTGVFVARRSIGCKEGQCGHRAMTACTALQCSSPSNPTFLIRMTILVMSCSLPSWDLRRRQISVFSAFTNTSTLSCRLMTHRTFRLQMNTVLRRTKLLGGCFDAPPGMRTTHRVSNPFFKEWRDKT